MTTPLRVPAAFLAAVLIAVNPACSRPQSHAPNGTSPGSVEAAETAYFRFDLAQASAIYEHVWADRDSTDRDRAKAGSQLARFAVLFEQDIGRARKLLSGAEEIEGERVSALLTLARIEREHGDYARALAAAERAAASSGTPIERVEADTEFAWAVLESASAAILRGEVDKVDHELLSDAFGRIRSVLDVRPGVLDPSLVGLELALILGKGSAVLDAWNSYFHVAPGTVPTGVLERPGLTLARLTPDWNGEMPAQGTRTELVQALAGSRMFRSAALLASLGHATDTPPDPGIRDILAYTDYLAAIDRITSAFYRASAAGAGDSTRYRGDLEREAAALWPRLHWPQEPPQFSSSAFAAELGRRFGTQIELKTANGHFGLHMGHRVIDEDYQVEQYGQKATLNFIALDLMVSNGYSSWFWDGRANVGGWADNPVITQIRPAYAGAGVENWERITDPKLRTEAEEEIARHAAMDLELARKDPAGYLPGLALRVGFEATERVRAELEAGGLEGADLRLAFIAEVERIDFESSIIAHEGRHAIDARQAGNSLRSSATKEYRAKLSEIAFSSAPFLAIDNGILSRNIGDGTAHGTANQRIMEGLVQWMERHRTTIDGLDSSLPLLPQLDLLSDDQLREAFRSLDPMAS